MITCPICNREIIEGPSSDEHHLIPKTFKGRETVRLHKICHQKIHATFSERELMQYYHTVDRLVENEEMQKFITWVQKKNPEFYDVNRDTASRKRKRKR